MSDRIAAQLRRVDQALRHDRKVRAIERVIGPLTPARAGMRELPPIGPNDPRLARLAPDDPRLEQRIEPAGDQ